MGNTSSTDAEKLKPKPVDQIIDYIATQYILTMDFVSLRKLYDKEYCDKLVILTSNIIENEFTNMDIKYLAQRVKDGVEVNKMEDTNISFFDKDNLDKLDIKNKTTKRRMCIGIAKFYIKIAHIFAAIVMTINPIYMYKDAVGNRTRVSLYEKGRIPTNAPRTIEKMNICNNRIRSLKRGFGDVTLDDISKGSNFNVHPNVCSINVDTQGNDKTLNDEPGIPELMQLYYDDVYNYETGEFTGMSEKTKKIYEEDLKIFYNIFSDGSPQPPNITKFSDIKLREFQYGPGCKGNNAPLNRSVTDNTSNKLFADYANNLKEMIHNTTKNREALLGILNQLFVYTTNPITKKREVKVVGQLTEAKLQKIVVETRALIIKLYLTCEMNYVTGIKIYEAIVEEKILQTSQNQIRTLETMAEKMTGGSL